MTYIMRYLFVYDILLQFQFTYWVGGLTVESLTYLSC